MTDLARPAVTTDQLEASGSAPSRVGYDRVLFAVVIVLMALGIVLVYSASIVSAQQNFGDAQHYLKRQSIYAVLTLTVMGVFMNVHYMFWAPGGKWVLGAAILGLIMVLIPGLSTVAKGAARWISLGPIRIQPSEVVKLAWLIFLAFFVALRKGNLHDFRESWTVPLVCMSIIHFLLMAQPDFSVPP